MEFDAINDILHQIKGCTFASLDSTTQPKPGISCVTTGARVLLFTNKNFSGYDAMVKRRLVQAGKNPSDFVLSDLPWGERVPETPIIAHNNRFYLQTVLLNEGEKHYYLIDGSEIAESDLEAFGVKERRTNQGLARGDEVVVNTYAFDHIDRIKLLGQEYFSGARGANAEETVC